MLRSRLPPGSLHSQPDCPLGELIPEDAELAAGRPLPGLTWL